MVQLAEEELFKLEKIWKHLLIVVVVRGWCWNWEDLEVELM